MNVLVCVKQVKGELNPFDASALECALRIPKAEVTIISMGRPDVSDMLKGLTRLGASRAILLTDNAFAGSDTLATSYVLSLAIKRIMPDLIICGRQSVDGDTGQVGPCLSAMLGIPVITNVMELLRADDNVECITRFGNETAATPALLTVEKGYTLRFPGLRSKPREVEVWGAKDIDADIKRCGLKGSPTKVLKTYESTVGRRKCEFIKPEQLYKIIEKSKNTPRHHVERSSSSMKIPEVWAVGYETAAVAETIAKKVRIIERQSPNKIAELASKEKPQVILWDSGLWGRKNAPQVAAFLQTGLCADCTMLETDGEQLFMYRPAYGGSIMAKIACSTRPQMATVRTVDNKSEQVIISVGSGAAKALPKLEQFAKSNGYAIGASRTVVDKGTLPYECQIGLTGRSVSPAVYIACGISGAVQHTCAIEQAGTVIAINTDKDARIFDYADYGVIGECGELLRKCDKFNQSQI